MFFQFMFIVGVVLAFYGYSVMRNPRTWGEQGKERIKPENWNGYVVRNGQFFLYSGLFITALSILDMLLSLNDWLYIGILLLGIALLMYPLCHWMKQKEGTWNPWPRKKKKK